MGSSASQSSLSGACCVHREKEKEVRKEGRSCCENTLLGEDAFFRDAQPEDTVPLLEQATLKTRKASLAAGYVKFELKRALSSRGADDDPPAGRHQPLGAAHGIYSSTSASNWLGKTIKQWGQDGDPSAAKGLCWMHGFGRGLKVRTGPEYAWRRGKVDSQGSMYETLSVDIIKAEAKIEDIVQRLVKLPPSHKGNREGWTPDSRLPRVICINLKLPYTTGLNPWARDGGCSCVGFFHIRPGTLKAAMSPNPPPCVKLFQRFFEGPAGKPGGPVDDPARSLAMRLERGVKRDLQSGLLKAVAQCQNPEDLSVPDMFHQYNGKPCIIAKCGYAIKDPAGEWLELGIDVRGFNPLARKMLCSFRDILPRARIHYAFLIQGVEDDELPEGLICDMIANGVDIMKDPWHIEQD